MTVNASDAMWVERHRPQTLDEMAGHDVIIERLKRYVDDDSVPHMLFSGPPGTGKTTAAKCFAREVYGDNWTSRFTEMNASDERGIDTIRDKVKGVARSKPAGGETYQIIFLDEADYLTSEAQAALRSMMEEYSDITRFFLTCNYPGQIIEAIQSRCVPLRFGKVEDSEVMDTLKGVSEKEGIDYNVRALDMIVRDSKGDIRSAVNSLQNSVIDGEVNAESVETVVGAVDDELIREIFDLAISGETDEAMYKMDMDILKEGAPSEMVCDCFLRVIKDEDVPQPAKNQMVSCLGVVDRALRDGANPNIQMHSLICDIGAARHIDHGRYE